MVAEQVLKAKSSKIWKENSLELENSLEFELWNFTAIKY